MPRGMVGKSRQSWVLVLSLNTRDFDLTCTNIEPSEDFNNRLTLGHVYSEEFGLD